MMNTIKRKWVIHLVAAFMGLSMMAGQSEWFAVQPAGYSGLPVKIWINTVQEISAVQFTLSGLPPCVEFESLVPLYIQDWEIDYLDTDNFPSEITVQMSLDEYEVLMSSTQKICDIQFTFPFPETCGGSDMVLSNVQVLDFNGQIIPLDIINNPFCDRIKADLNNDFRVDVMDIVLSINMLMAGYETNDICEAWTADFNDHWNIMDFSNPWFVYEPPIPIPIDILDIVYLVTLILGL